MVDSKTFVNLVLQKSATLLERGYKVDSLSLSFDGVIDFRKHLIQDEVACIITIKQMRANATKFDVSLMRSRLKNYSLGESIYENLFFRLPALMEAVYGIRIFPDNKQNVWQFDDINNLEKGLESAINLILDYCIKWLEDPHTKPGWPNRRQK
jgi:hypothetical protein